WCACSTWPSTPRSPPSKCSRLRNQRRQKPSRRRSARRSSKNKGMARLCLLVLLLVCPLPAGAESPAGWPRPPRFRVVTLAERGGGEHQKFVDAAKVYL